MKEPNIADVRAHLFAALAALRDKDAPLDLDRAREISNIAQTIINSAKVEVDYLKVAGSASHSSFLESATELPPLPLNVRTHRIKG